MPLAAFIAFAAGHGVAPLRYSFEDFEEKRQSADVLKRGCRIRFVAASD
jgi:hypothetical protein